MRKGSVVALVQLPVTYSNRTASNRKLGVGLGTRLGLLTIECFFGCAESALIEPMFGVVLLHWLGFNAYMM